MTIPTTIGTLGFIWHCGRGFEISIPVGGVSADCFDTVTCPPVFAWRAILKLLSADVRILHRS